MGALLRKVVAFFAPLLLQTVLHILNSNPFRLKATNPHSFWRELTAKMRWALKKTSLRQRKPPTFEDCEASGFWGISLIISPVYLSAIQGVVIAFLHKGGSDEH